MIAASVSTVMNATIVMMVVLVVVSIVQLLGHDAVAIIHVVIGCKDAIIGGSYGGIQICMFLIYSFP